VGSGQRYQKVGFCCNFEEISKTGWLTGWWADWIIHKFIK